MYLPEKILTNDDISEFVDTSHEWIFERTGIRQRHIASEHQMTSDLAYMSALNAIQDANINAEDLDLIILATSTPDPVSYTHLRAHETRTYLVCRLLL